ncbi:MAG: hypothetical protein KG029_15515 [Bacteroidetes bacterium]|nr:hypothetical protein [Bacteroidota bacterium]
MKTSFITLIITLIALTGFSQKPEYYQAMGESLGQYASCKTPEDFQALGNRFSMIANNEKEEWLPIYYHAHCYIIMSFMEPSDAKKKDSYLDVAEKSLKQLETMVPGEAEVFALQAMLYTARLVVNPMERGQQYSMLIGQSLGRASALDPSNPRAKLLKIQNNMGSANHFGKDPKEFCGQATDLLAGWETYTPKSQLHPAWGKDQAEELVRSCR